MPSPWDLLLARRALLASCALLAVTAAVVAATDEVSATWASRAARLCVLAPVLGGLGGGVVVHQAERRGELRALAASGASPWGATRGAAWGGGLPASIAAALLAAGIGSLEGLFPRLSGTPFRLVGSAFVAASSGLCIEDGAVSFFPPREVPTAVVEPRMVLGCLVLAAAALVPAFCVSSMSVTRRALFGGASASTAVIAFHLVAGGAPAPWLLASLAPLLVERIASLRRQNPLPTGGGVTTVTR